MNDGLQTHMGGFCFVETPEEHQEGSSFGTQSSFCLVNSPTIGINTKAKTPTLI